MISKKTSKNQITLPKKIVSQFPECEYFDISAEEGRIIEEIQSLGYRFVTLDLAGFRSGSLNVTAPGRSQQEKDDAR